MAKKRRGPSPLEEYLQKEGTYQDLAICVRDLIVQIIASHGITVHSVTCRAKSHQSLSGKLQKTGKDYKSLADITDLAGVRVITYFTDDAERVAALLEAEFDVDRGNSADKRRLLEPNQFGYLSIHHVATLSGQRTDLAEYARFKGLKVELQTRSILQHAWAEIEHDLGYKSTVAVPKKLRRRITRLAGLLELADQEFQAVRRDISNYERDLPSLVRDQPRTVEVDQSSLEAYIRVSDFARETDKRIASAIGATLTSTTFVDYSVARLNWLGTTNLATLDDQLHQYADSVVRFATAFLERSGEGMREDEHIIRAGMCLFYLAYVLVAQRPLSVVEEFVRVTLGPSSAKHFATHLKTTWASITQSGASVSASKAKRSNRPKKTRR